MGLSFKKALILSAIEATPGTAETLVAGDGAMVVRNPQYSQNNTNIERDFISPDHGTLASLPGSISGQISFDTELKPGASLGVAPQVGKLLRMCGFSETLDAGVDVEYALGGSGFEHGTVAFDLQDDGGGNGPRYAIKGAHGNLVFSAEVGGLMNIAATLTGAYITPTDVAALSPTFETKIPPIFKDGTFTIGGVALKVRRFSIDLRNQIVLTPDINEASGFALARYGSRAPQITFDAELTTITTHNFTGLIENATESALVLQSQVTANNTVRMEATKLQYTNISFNNQDNIPVVSVTGQLNRGGTHELLIRLL